MISPRERISSFLVCAAWLLPLCGCDSPRDDGAYEHRRSHHGHYRWGDTAGSSGIGAGPTSEVKRRNVIVMIGDGMPTVSEVAASRYLHGTDFGLSFHALPYMAFKTTWDVTVYDTRAADVPPHYAPASFDPRVGYDPDLGGSTPYPLTPDSDEIRSYFSANGWLHPDSAATATAMATGVKTTSAAIAWQPYVDVDGAIETSAEQLRRIYGMAVGFVTTVPFSHATPAGFFSHNVHRDNTTGIGNEILNVVRPDVVIGGGWQDTTYYLEMDLERALASNDWVFSHLDPNLDSNDAVLAAAVRANQSNKRLLGIYGGGERTDFIAPVPASSPGAPHVDVSALDRPLLPNSSVAALEVLSRDPDGFVLVIEQGHIDWANHDENFSKVVGGVWELDQAVQAVTAFIDRPNDDIGWSNTTLLVTADHANGYMRFANSLGVGELPEQGEDPDTGATVYPNGEITFNSGGGHTSELVSVYAKGFAASKLHEYENIYPGTRILDDTSIYRLTMDAARR